MPTGAPPPVDAARAEVGDRGLAISGIPASDRFEILARLGEGGSAEVFRALDRELEEIVALKVLRPEVARDPVAQARLRRELRLNRRIKSPHVAAAYSLAALGDRECLVMELVTGVSLRRVLTATGPLPEADAVRYATGVLEALAVAHDVGVVHLDLKPDNLMITPRDEIVLLDFGIAREAWDPERTLTDTIVGTPAYIAPEQIEGRAVTPATDLYGLGCVLHEMLTGRPPFHSTHGGLATAFLHLSEEPPPLREQAPGVSEGLAEVVLRCLAKDPADRYPHARALAAALEAVRGGGGDAPPKDASASGSIPTE